jgi:hypothetical protein
MNALWRSFFYSILLDTLVGLELSIVNRLRLYFGTSFPLLSGMILREEGYRGNDSVFSKFIGS